MSRHRSGGSGLGVRVTASGCLLLPAANCRGLSGHVLAEQAKNSSPKPHSLAAMQLESPDPAGTDPARHPPAAAMQQSPESRSRPDEATARNFRRTSARRCPASEHQRIRDFARPVFRRCGRQLRIAETKSNRRWASGLYMQKPCADERRSYPRDSQQANGAENGRLPLDVGRAPLADGRGHARHLHRGPRILSSILRFTPHGAAWSGRARLRLLTVPLHNMTEWALT